MNRFVGDRVYRIGPGSNAEKNHSTSPHQIFAIHPPILFSVRYSCLVLALVRHNRARQTLRPCSDSSSDLFWTGLDQTIGPRYQANHISPERLRPAQTLATSFGAIGTTCRPILFAFWDPNFEEPGKTLGTYKKLVPEDFLSSSSLTSDSDTLIRDATVILLRSAVLSCRF